EYQAKAVDAVMPYLDKKLTGGTLSQAQKDAIKAYVVNNVTFTKFDRSARKLIATVVRMIVATDAYVIQK
ncbi:MAG: hypothetical protein ABFS03_14415, partial [Chloroflexota bacterium]